MKLEQSNQTIVGQFIVRGLIFLLFFLGIFFSLPSVLLYFLLPLIIANLVLGFIHKKRDIFTNITFLFLYPLLFIVLVEYIATIIGTILSFVHVLIFGLWYMKEIKK